MGTIEQAAKRLEQLKQAGLDVETGTRERATQRSTEVQAEPLPLRVTRELEARRVGTPSQDDSLRGPAMHLLATAGGVDAGGAAIVVPAGIPPAATLLSHPPQSTAVSSGVDSGQRVDLDLARLSANGYVTPHAPRSRLAEEFRVIKRPLLMNARGRSAAAVVDGNLIMVTSAMPGEGKTYVSVNLAISLAMELDTQVLLVEADTTRPAVLEHIGLNRRRGLLDLLVEPSLAPESLILSTNVDRLSILPAGTPQEHSAELIASEGLSRLVRHLSSGGPSRIVVFDTPPLLGASESRVLAAQMGQVILVVAADDTPQGTVAEALATIENCPVVLTLLNRVSHSDRGYYYGSYSSGAN